METAERDWTCRTCRDGDDVIVRTKRPPTSNGQKFCSTATCMRSSGSGWVGGAYLRTMPIWIQTAWRIVSEASRVNRAVFSNSWPLCLNAQHCCCFQLQFYVRQFCSLARRETHQSPPLNFPAPFSNYVARVAVCIRIQIGAAAGLRLGLTLSEATFRNCIIRCNHKSASRHINYAMGQFLVYSALAQ